MFRIGSVECNEFNKICEEQGITEFPTYRVYPPFPVPHADMQSGDSELDTDKLKKMAFKHIGNRVIDVSSTNHDVFKDDNPGKPKVLLFTESKKAPIVYRALSEYFDQTLLFGMVKSDDEALVKKYKVTSFPSLYILKNNEKAPIKFEDGEFKYSEIFEFINTYSETFVFGQQKESAESAASKPWLTQPIPFLSKDSGNELCLKKDGILCVIYLVNSAAESDQAVLDAFANVKEAFTSKIERGITFNFLRLDVTAEADFAAPFALEDGQVPGIVVLNPGKKKRFLKHEYDLTEEGITQTLDKILGGDARFKIVKGNKLPELTQSHDIFLQ